MEKDPPSTEKLEQDIKRKNEGETTSQLSERLTPDEKELATDDDQFSKPARMDGDVEDGTDSLLQDLEPDEELQTFFSLMQKHMSPDEQQAMITDMINSQERELARLMEKNALLDEQEAALQALMQRLTGENSSLEEQRGIIQSRIQQSDRIIERLELYEPLMRGDPDALLRADLTIHEVAEISDAMAQAKAFLEEKRTRF